MATGNNRRKPPLPAYVIAQYTLVIVAILAASLLIWQIKGALLLAFAGIIVATIIGGMARGLQRVLPLSRGWALAGAGLEVVVFSGLFILIFGSQIVEQFDELMEKLPQQVSELQQSVREWPMSEHLLDGDENEETPKGDQNAEEAGQTEVDGGEDYGGNGEESGAGSDSLVGNAGEENGSQTTEDNNAGAGAENGRSEARDGNQSITEGEQDDAEKQENGTEQGIASMEGTGGMLLQAGATLIDILATLALVLSVGVFLAINPEIYREGILLLVTEERTERVGEALDASGNALWQWLMGQLVSMSFVGITVALGLWIVGVPLALILGLIAGLLDFVPYIGPIVAILPGILLALAEGPQTALWAALVYLIAQQLEGNVVTPLIQRRKVSIPPALVILAVVAFGLLFGIPGIILATPLAVVTMVLVGMLYVEDVLGKKISIPGKNT